MVFNRNNWNYERSKKWLREHGYRYDTYISTVNQHRFIQAPLPKGYTLQEYGVNGQRIMRGGSRLVVRHPEQDIMLLRAFPKVRTVDDEFRHVK